MKASIIRAVTLQILSNIGIISKNKLRVGKMKKTINSIQNKLPFFNNSGFIGTFNRSIFIPKLIIILAFILIPGIPKSFSFIAWNMNNESFESRFLNRNLIFQECNIQSIETRIVDSVKGFHEGLFELHTNFEKFVSFNGFNRIFSTPFLSEPSTKNSEKASNQTSGDDVRIHGLHPFHVGEIVGGILGLIIVWFIFHYLPNFPF